MLGAILGGSLSGLLSDKLGRRKMILLSALIFMAGSVLSASAPHNGSYFLIAARILLGLAVGAASALVPAYMSEMAPARLRGRLSGDQSSDDCFWHAPFLCCRLFAKSVA